MADHDKWVITWTETVHHHQTVDPGIIGQVMSKQQFAAHLTTHQGILTEWSELGQSGRTTVFSDIAVRSPGERDITLSTPQTSPSDPHHHDWGQT